MERRESRLEELPPLELRELRRLDLAEAPAPGRPARLVSASGVVRRGDFVYVIGDELRVLGVFRFSEPGPGTVRRVLGGEDDADGEHKPDLEALTLLPPTATAPYGTLLGLGSGSAPGRDRAFAWALAPAGDLRGEPREIDLAPLYELLGRHVDALNVEGACVMGDRLWLLHRGNRGDRVNVVAELSLAAVAESLRGDERFDAAELAAVRSYDLGDLDGIALTFSDATPVGGDLLVFTASAEDDGGTIHGSVIGTIDRGGEVRRMRTIDRRYKVEGVHAALDTGVLDLLLVCDQDDPDAPAPLLAAAMPIDGELERAALSSDG